uniref:Transcription factor bHLH14 n=1 Tax=Nothapodytes nimmoniana TaxID=159386 RepID=A0A9E9C654_NOTNI|nr:transcription factor bHLH14 [Nothapodytes nimmoniana]
MEEFFFQYELLPQGQGDLSLFDGMIPVNQSAFVPYSSNSVQVMQEQRFWQNGFLNHGNANKRMIELLKKNWTPTTTAVSGGEAEKERCYKHMISERIRRKNQKQSYLDLHNLLPPGTKNDKNSIIQMATKRIQELLRFKEELKKKDTKIEEVLPKRERDNETKFKLKVTYPLSSGIDSMLDVLKCLKNLGCQMTLIQSECSPKEMSAVIEVETKVGAVELEKAMRRNLKLRGTFCTLY